MKRTQILLPDDLHRKLVKHAKTRKTSMGDLVRRAVERAYFARVDEMALVAYWNGLISLGELAESRERIRRARSRCFGRRG